MELGNKLKEYRSKSGLSQEELAKNVNVSRQTIISIEKSVYEPSVKLAIKIAKKLNLKVEDIFYINK